MHILSAIMGFLLILFTAVQYNDPDGVYWGMIYSVAAAWCLLAAFKPGKLVQMPFNVLLGLSVAAAIAGVFYYWPQTPGWWTQDVWWETETAREGMGMMIALVAVLVAAITVFIKRPARPA